jgi:hypothetical protein
MDPRISAELARKIPGLLLEMRNDLREHPLTREFVLLKAAWSYFSDRSEFQYYYDEHPELDGMVRILKNYDLVEDISDAKVKRYVIREELADYLTGTMADDQTGPEQFTYLFRKDGEVWAMSFDGRTAHIKDMLGLAYIAELLRHPRTQIEAAQLAGVSGQSAKFAATAGLPRADAKTIRAVRKELSERQDEMAHVLDRDRKEVLQKEIADLKKYLSGVEDHRGQARKLAGTAQRARTSVTNAICRAIDHISRQHSELGQHLKSSIQTGTTMVYTPENVPDWHF